MSASHAPLAAADRHRPLVAGARVRLDAASCLPERFPANACDICVEACPLALLETGGGAPRLIERASFAADACIGCGQCAARCPSGALQVDGFAVPAGFPDARELLVDCWRVPGTESPPGALRVPCLGGLGLGWLLLVFDRSGERPIRLLEHGHCADCPAGPGIRELLATISEARMLLAECGVDLDAMPMLAFRPGAVPLLPAIPDAGAETPLPRRGFFRSLLGESLRTAEAARPAAAQAVNLRVVMQPLERMRVMPALAGIARRHARPLPVRALPHLSLGECDANGVCAAVCPTGALHQAAAAGRVELRFDSMRCIACAQCARVCPGRSLRLDNQGGAAGVAVLATWLQRECARCGADFSDPATTAERADEADLCPVCRKTEALSMGVAAFLRPSRGSDVSQPKEE